MFCSIRSGHLWLAALSYALLTTHCSATLYAQESAGTEATIMLLMSPKAFQSFVLPNSEDAVGILLTGPSDGDANSVTTASGNFGDWGGTYHYFKTAKYICKGGVSSVSLRFRSTTVSELPPCLKIGADRGLDVEFYYCSEDGSGNLIEDPEGGAVVVFLYGTF